MVNWRYTYVLGGFGFNMESNGQKQQKSTIGNTYKNLLAPVYFCFHCDSEPGTAFQKGLLV